MREPPVPVRRPNRGLPHLRDGAVAVALAIALAGCASGDPTPSPTPSLSPPEASVSSTPSGPSGSLPSTSVPRLSTGRSVPSTTPQTLRGIVGQGVESGCIVLVDSAGAVTANLQGLDLATVPIGSSVEVTGTFQPDLMTTCQQGTPFDVQSAKRL